MSVIEKNSRFSSNHSSTNTNPEIINRVVKHRMTVETGLNAKRSVHSELYFVPRNNVQEKPKPKRSKTFNAKQKQKSKSLEYSSSFRSSRMSTFSTRKSDRDDDLYAVVKPRKTRVERSESSSRYEKSSKDSKHDRRKSRQSKHISKPRSRSKSNSYRESRDIKTSRSNKFHSLPTETRNNTKNSLVKSQSINGKVSDENLKLKFIKLKIPVYKAGSSPTIEYFV